VNVLISVDMEGVAGVVLGDQTTSAHKDYERFRKLMTAETNAAIEGALAGGATTVVVNDSHGNMTNILIEELNAGAELISGSPKPFGMMQGISPAVDRVCFMGYHAASGTGDAVLAHTWTGRIVEVALNEQVVGETGLNAALAGSYGVPVVLVSGDTAVTTEARGLLGDIETVAVKEGISQTAARCLHPDVACARIREAAERAMMLTVSPFVISPPITARIAFQRPIYAEMAALIPGSERVDGCTVTWTGNDMPTVYKAFQAMASLSFAV
jgi:D-amino peptidase